MELFLFSNIVITLMAVLYNRYSKSSISAKLTLSTFALSCWIIPFTLIRDYLPQEVAVNVQWLVPLQSNISQTIPTAAQVSWLSQITLTHILVFMSFIGLFFLMVRLFKHHQWINKLKNDPQSKLIGEHNGQPVYQSDQINNALLIGYKSPSIWINTKLVNSPYFEIIIEHEATHMKNRDNYWLAIMEVIRAVYWWNPLIRMLIENIKEHLETRCDYKASQSFTEGVYYQKLTDLILSKLMLNQQPVTHTGFVSAVISKNLNIRRLKTLKEKQTMNLFSKIMISVLLVSGVTILTLPVSSLNSFASSDNEKKSKDETISINFKKIPIPALAIILAENLQLEPVVSDSVNSEVVSININSYPKSKLLSMLTTTFNISFEQKGKQLIITSLPGEVTNKFDTYDNTKGVMLDLNIIQISKKAGDINTKNVEASIWTNFNTSGSIHFNDMWELEIIANEKTENQIYLEMRLYSIENADSKVLIAEPKLLVSDNKPAEVEFGDEEGNTIHFTVIPKKMSNPTDKS